MVMFSTGSAPEISRTNFVAKAPFISSASEHAEHQLRGELRGDNPAQAPRAKMSSPAQLRREDVAHQLCHSSHEDELCGEDPDPQALPFFEPHGVLHPFTHVGADRCDREWAGERSTHSLADPRTNAHSKCSRLIR